MEALLNQHLIHDITNSILKEVERIKFDEVVKEVNKIEYDDGGREEGSRSDGCYNAYITFTKKCGLRVVLCYEFITYSRNEGDVERDILSMGVTVDKDDLYIRIDGFKRSDYWVEICYCVGGEVVVDSVMFNDVNEGYDYFYKKVKLWGF